MALTFQTARKSLTQTTIARSIIASANPGLVEKLVPSGTWTAANRAGSEVQVLGRYKARSMNA